MMPLSLPQRTVSNQTPLEASKWLKIQLLVDADEMKDLLHELGDDFEIFLTSGVMDSSEGLLSREDFLKTYRSYVSDLIAGKLPDESLYRSCFSSVFTKDREALYALPVGENQHLIRVQKPVLQLQLHRMAYSPEDGNFHTMVFGKDSIAWGIQFSYPQLYRDHETKQVEKVVASSDFPNTFLFRSLQQWVRKATIPTPFMIQDRLTNVPVRLGKNCLSWINKHPNLIQKGIKVA